MNEQSFSKHKMLIEIMVFFKNVNRFVEELISFFSTMNKFSGILVGVVG